MASDHPVRLSSSHTNPFGATFWTVSLNTTCDGRGRGGLSLEIDVHTQSEGVCIAGNYISWDELMAAKAYAESKAKKVA